MPARRISMQPAEAGALDGFDAFFEKLAQPAHCRPLGFSPFKRGGNRRNARPRHLSRIPNGTNIASAYRGAELSGLAVLKQGEEVAAVMEARDTDATPLYPTVGLLIPRRSTKTTAVWNVILGRCDSTEGYKVVTTAQDGTRARNRFRDVLRALDRADFEGKRNPANRRGRLLWGKGDEAVEFDNGSRIWVVKPDAEALRGEAADLIFFDEAGELSLEKSADLIAGALPLMDTRPNGQIVIAGTPGTERAGLLWETIEDGRNGRGSTGVLDYSAADEDSTQIPGPDGELVLNEALVRRTHPGIGTLTTMKVIRSRYQKMPLEQFEREYLCRYPLTSAVAALDIPAWTDCKEDEPLERPDRIGVAFDVAPDGSAGAVVGAWRDEAGKACFELLAYEYGTAWLPGELRRTQSKYRDAIAYDIIGANQDPAERAQRARVRLQGLGLKHMQGAAARLAQEIHRKNVRYWDQPDLTAAVNGAVWRNVGDSGRLFARKASSSDVSPVVAMSEALWVFDLMPEKTPVKIRRSKK